MRRTKSVSARKRSEFIRGVFVNPDGTETPWMYVHSPEFAGASRSEFLAAMPDQDVWQADFDRNRRRTDPDNALHMLCCAPLLTREQEWHLARKLNYSKYLYYGRREDDSSLLAAAVAAKQQLALCNTRLVVNWAKKQAARLARAEHGTSQNIMELFSDGYLVLERAIERFDYLLRFRFSTYATWSMYREASRHHLDRLQTNAADALFEMLATADDEEDGDVSAEATRVLRHINRLEPRERRIVLDRTLGPKGDGEKATLETIGRDLGITKERVRQIYLKSVGKVRGSLRDAHGNLPLNDLRRRLVN